MTSTTEEAVMRETVKDQPAEVIPPEPTVTASATAVEPETELASALVQEREAEAEKTAKSASKTGKKNTPAKEGGKGVNGTVVVVTSGKGGVGKTTTTANIGTGLARMGYKVALVDTDIGLRNLDLLMGLENRIVYNIVDVVEERCKLQQALVKDKRLPNLALLPAAQTRDKSALNPEQMEEVCEQLKRDFDFVLVDSPAGIEQGFLNAIAGASQAIVVCTPEMSAVRDADRIIGLLEAKEDITNYKLVLNRVRPAMIKTNDMMDVDDVLEILSIKLLGVIPEDKDIIISTNKGEPVVAMEQSLAGQAYRNIARRVAGEDVPFLNLDAPTSWLDKVKNFFTKSA
ncbi:MAG: septum site-determining protein MinD [Vampirovibrionales bacterium]|nr:septum site-determining protein MinD [Vampirovibrionales bacterium]